MPSFYVNDDIYVSITDIARQLSDSEKEELLIELERNGTPGEREQVQARYHFADGWSEWNSATKVAGERVEVRFGIPSDHTLIDSFEFRFHEGGETIGGMNGPAQILNRGDTFTAVIDMIPEWVKLVKA